MTDKTSALMRNVIVMLAGATSVLVLAFIWHQLGWARPAVSQADELTGYLSRCVGWPFIAVYLAAGLALGWLARRVWSVALGMILPLLGAFLIEVVRDPTSHNLIPFEVVLFWTPALALALAAAYAGVRLRRVERLAV